MSSSSNFALQYPTTPPTSLTSDDNNDEVFTPKFDNLAQLTPYTPIRHPTPLQLCQPTTPTPETRRNLRLQKIVCNQTSSVPTIFPNHRQLFHLTTPLLFRQWLLDCKIWHWTPIRHAMRGDGMFGLRQIIRPSYWKKIVADYLNQTAQPGETVREGQKKRNAFIDGIQSGVFTFLP